MDSLQLGITDGISNEEYHGDRTSISKSHLDAIAKSPLHYWSEFRDHQRVRKEPTPAMILGTAVHMAILEPDKFESQVISSLKFDRRTKAGAAAAAEFEAANAGKIILTAEDFIACQRMRDAVHANAESRRLLSAPGKAEQTVAWDQDGILCKCRPDYLASDGAQIVDLKTTEDASPAGFARSVAVYRYHVQNEWYRHGLNETFGIYPDFVFLAVEKAPPYAVALYRLDESACAEGHAEMMRNFETLKSCIESDIWPGYPEEISSISLPKWAFKNTNHTE